MRYWAELSVRSSQFRLLNYPLSILQWPKIWQNRPDMPLAIGRPEGVRSVPIDRKTLSTASLRAKLAIASGIAYQSRNKTNIESPQ